VDKIKQNPIVKKLGFNRIILFLILLLMYGVFSIVVPGFASKARIMSILNYAYFLGFLALGVTFVIATGGIDFSIGPVMFCCALMSGYTLNTYGAPVIVSLLMSIAIGFCFGCFNGFLVAYVGVPPFIVSMATMNIAKGLGSVFTKTQSVSWPQANDPSGNGWFRNLVKVNDIPTGLFIFLAAVVILYIVMNHTKAGRYILCLGSNKEAVRISGVNVRKWQMLAYVICGTMAELRLFSSSPRTPQSSRASATPTTMKPLPPASWAVHP
jgi:ribose transport system permease protein